MATPLNQIVFDQQRYLENVLTTSEHQSTMFNICWGLLTNTINDQNQRSQNLCWACSSAQSLRTLIWELFGVDQPSDHLFKVIMVRRIKYLMMTKTPQTITANDFLSNGFWVANHLKNVPIFNSQGLPYGVFSVNGFNIIEPPQVRDVLAEGHHPVACFNNHPVLGNHMMTVYGYTRNGIIKCINSARNSSDLWREAHSPLSQVCGYDISLYDIQAMDIDDFKVGFGAYCAEINNESKKVDTPRNLVLNFKDKDESARPKITIDEFSFESNKEFMMENFKKELTSGKIIQPNPNKVFVNGYWRYRWGTKPKDIA